MDGYNELSPYAAAGAAAPPKAAMSENAPGAPTEERRAVTDDANHAQPARLFSRTSQPSAF